MSDTENRVSIGDTAINQDPKTLVLQYGDYKVPVSELSAKALSYLLQNGFSQSMTDAAALTKAQKSEKTGRKTTDGDGKEVDEMRPLSEAALEEKVNELRDARFAKILAGEVGIRVGGPRGTQMDNIIRQVATEFMRAKLAKHKLTLPTGKDASGNAKTLTIKVDGVPTAMTREDLISREIEKNGDAVREEAERRKALQIDEAEEAGEGDDIDI